MQKLKRIGLVLFILGFVGVPLAFATPGTGVTIEQMTKLFNSGSNGGQAHVFVEGNSSQGGTLTNPVVAGAVPTAQGSTPTAHSVVTSLSADQAGALFVRQGGPNVWTCTLSALANTLTQCQAAPGSGRLNITDIAVQTTTATAGTYQIKYGTGSNCGTGTTSLMGFAATAPVSTAQTQYEHLVSPMVPAATNAVCVIGTATNTINIQLWGFVGP